MKTLAYIIIGALIGLLAAGVLWLAATPPRGEPVILLSTQTPGVLTVYVSGAVVVPGLYTLPVNSRVIDAVQAAGGFMSSAETELINLAAPLVDGQQIDVPGIVSTRHVNAGRVNINTATVAEFDTLPGIGPTTAQAIVEYRLQHGLFQFVQDIQNVPGIGPATYAKIKDYLTVEP
jgi:competence protein ComEA